MAILVVAAAGAALAAGASADLELVRPVFSPGGVPGVDTLAFEPGVWRIGALAQYQQDPLILYEWGEEVGAVVRNRLTTHLGVARDFTPRVSARMTLPVIAQWGSEVPELAADGAGAGDLGAGLRALLYRWERLGLGLRTDLVLPTGAADAWMGEALPRASGAALVSLALGEATLTAAPGIAGRFPVGRVEDLDLRSELTCDLSARREIWPERAAIGAGLLLRGPAGGLLQDPAANSAELLTAGELWPIREVAIDLGVGKGLSGGYGTSALRMFAGVTWRPDPPAPAPVETVEIPPLEESEPIVFEEPPPPVEVSEAPLAEVTHERIEIRDPIRFAFGTDEILPESQPVIDAVAAVMAAHGDLNHVLIEGHTSEEGDYDYNFELSNRRAEAIFKALVLAGVHPSRLSYRGMGEVEPTREGEEALAENRRVVFRIITRLAPGEDPGLAPEIRLPWSGERVVIPAAPVPEAPEPEPDPDADPFDLFGEEEGP